MHDSTRLDVVGLDKENRFPGLFALFYVVVFVQGFLIATWVGLRPLAVGTDTANYFNFYYEVVACQCLPGKFEIGFEAVAYLLALFDSDSSLLFFVMSFLNFLLMFGVAKKTAKHFLDRRESRKLFMVVLAAFLVSPFFLNSQINVIRQGLSVLFLFLAIFEARDRRFLRAVIWGLLSLSFHQTAALSLLSLFLLVLGRKVVLFATVLMAIVYVAGGSEAFVVLLSNMTGLDIYGRISGYAIGAEYKAGVRLDFAVFSIAIPVFVKCVVRFFNTSSEYLDWAVSIYLSLLMPFWFFGWANYSDRYAFTAWLFASVVLSIGLAPIIKKLSVGVVAIPSVISFFIFWYYLMSL